jgi:hypothetical protein
MFRNTASPDVRPRALWHPRVPSASVYVRERVQEAARAYRRNRGDGRQRPGLLGASRPSPNSPTRPARTRPGPSARSGCPPPAGRPRSRTPCRRGKSTWSTTPALRSPIPKRPRSGYGWDCGAPGRGASPGPSPTVPVSLPAPASVELVPGLGQTWSRVASRRLAPALGQRVVSQRAEGGRRSAPLHVCATAGSIPRVRCRSVSRSRTLDRVSLIVPRCAAHLTCDVLPRAAAGVAGL